MNSPLVIDIHYDYEPDIPVFEKCISDRPIIHRSQDRRNSIDHDIAGAEYALVWKSAPDLFERMPDLKVVFSLGAGVDHVLELPIPEGIPIVRFVDDSLTVQMSEWICLQCLMHLRRQRDYDRQQQNGVWGDISYLQASDVTVGVMGLGVLGLDAVKKLKALGFNVVGWSRSHKQVDGIETYDSSDLDQFLAKTDMLVGLLPLTGETTGLFNRSLFEKLARNGEAGYPVFINAGRGGSQVEIDILACIDDGTLGGASLDVFEHEPLSQDSELWLRENIIISPHVASVSSHAALAKYVAGQIKRFESGQALENLVDRARGY